MERAPNLALGLQLNILNQGKDGYHLMPSMDEFLSTIKTTFYMLPILILYDLLLVMNQPCEH